MFRHTKYLQYGILENDIPSAVRAYFLQIP